MSAVIIDGKKLANKIIEEIKNDVEKLNKQGIYPKIAFIMVGQDEASKIYIKNKTKACNEAGIQYEEILLDENIIIEELIETIEKLNSRKDIYGILLQSPIPKHLDINKAFKTIDHKKDIDGFNPINIGKLELNKSIFTPCTPLGIIKLLKEYNIELEASNVVIIGRSNIVGKPLAQCLLNENATVTICHSKTKNIKEITKNADILISAIGKPKFITEDMVKENAVVIDVGVNRIENKVVGDVDFENVKNKVSYITPVPGGIGPMTIAMLLNNVVIATKNLEK